MITYTRKGRYLVEGTAHNDQTEALEAAANLAIATPGKVVTVQPPVIEVLVKAPAGPVQTPTPISTVDKSIPFVLSDPTSGAEIVEVVQGSEVVYVAPNGSGSGAEADPIHPSKILTRSKPGTIFIHKPGVYDKEYHPGWAGSNYCLGSAQSGIALVGLPGAKIIHARPDGSCISLARGDAQALNNPNAANDVTIAGFQLVGGNGVIDGQYAVDKEESGARDCRVLCNDITAEYGERNTMSAVVTIGGDGWRVLGNLFHDFGSGEAQHNNHAVYVAMGADNVEISYNQFLRLRLGHQIQIHTDGGRGWKWDHILIYRNLLDGCVDSAGNRIGYARGITVSDVGDGSTVRIVGNILRNIADFSCVAVYGGIVEVLDNIAEHCNAPFLLISDQGGGKRQVTALQNQLTDVLKPYEFNSYHGLDLSAELVHD